MWWQWRSIESLIVEQDLVLTRPVTPSYRQTPVDWKLFCIYAFGLFASLVKSISCLSFAFFSFRLQQYLRSLPEVSFYTSLWKVLTRLLKVWWLLGSFICLGFSLRGSHPATHAFNDFTLTKCNGTMASAPLTSALIRALPLLPWMNRPETWRLISFGSWVQRGPRASFFFLSCTVFTIYSSIVKLVATECLLRHLQRCLYLLTSVAGINFSQCSGR